MQDCKLSFTLINKEGCFFLSSVLYSMFFCVLLGNLSKNKNQERVWKNRSAFDTNWLNYKQKLPLLHPGSANQTLSCPNIPSFPNSLKSLSTTFCWLLHTPCCYYYLLYISWGDNRKNCSIFKWNKQWQDKLKLKKKNMFWWRTWRKCDRNWRYK